MIMIKDKTILIVSDKTPTMEYIINIIKRDKNFRIIKLSKVKNAYNTIAKLNYNISLLIVDLTTRKRLQMLRELSLRKTRFPIIVTTKTPNNGYIKNYVKDKYFCLANITQLNRNFNKKMKVSIIQTYMNNCEILAK